MRRSCPAAAEDATLLEVTANLHMVDSVSIFGLVVSMVYLPRSVVLVITDAVMRRLVIAGR